MNDLLDKLKHKPNNASFEPIKIKINNDNENPEDVNVKKEIEKKGDDDDDNDEKNKEENKDKKQKGYIIRDLRDLKEFKNRDALLKNIKPVIKNATASSKNAKENLLVSQIENSKPIIEKSQFIKKNIKVAIKKHINDSDSDDESSPLKDKAEKEYKNKAEKEYKDKAEKEYKDNVDNEEDDIEKNKITHKKGVAVLGPEILFQIDNIEIKDRIPKEKSHINIHVDEYYMNNREKFIEFINSLFEPYRKTIEENKENINCDNIGKDSFTGLLTHQQIVRDYINLYTPYRGLLLYHGLGSGKTTTSIAIAEGMKSAKKIIVLTPASLRKNYIDELKKFGDEFYRVNQYWEWISIEDKRGDSKKELINILSGVLNLPVSYITKKKGAWLVNIKKSSNFAKMTTEEKNSINDQLDQMISMKYNFINYNGLRFSKYKDMTNNFTENLFDNAVVIIDEAHNLISRIVNKIKIDPYFQTNNKKTTKPRFLSTRIYDDLLSATNSRIILLSGTPVINYPNEFAILFNILRGYIKTWTMQLEVKSNDKITVETIRKILESEKTLDYIDYSPSSKTLTLTRNPFGFKNVYRGATDHKKYKGVTVFDGNISDISFEKNIMKLLEANKLIVIPKTIKITNYKALPDDFNLFINKYVNPTTKEILNPNAIKRRILGLSSYFKSAQESLMPRYTKTLGLDYHVINIPMSEFQFGIYEKTRAEERVREKESKKAKKNNADDNLEEIFNKTSSTYRIFSRLFCNYVMSDRPMISMEEKMQRIAARKKAAIEEPPIPAVAATTRGGSKTKKSNAPKKINLNDSSSENRGPAYPDDKLESEDEEEFSQENDIEDDEELENKGGSLYKEQIKKMLKTIRDNPGKYLSKDALKDHSPKFLYMLENIVDKNNVGLHLVYSQFRSMEGIGIFSLVLEANGFSELRLIRDSSGKWAFKNKDFENGRLMYAMYTGTESSEEKEIILNIYNGNWDFIPTNLAKELRAVSSDNKFGEIIKTLMITSSGSEGINLKNTRFVHIMEPYWNPVRVEQVIGRARRICSHKALPENLQTVDVFIYLMTFSEEQLKSDKSIELRLNDKGPLNPELGPVTSDQYLYQISEIKAQLANQLTEIIKESAFDCYIYGQKNCMNFANPKLTDYTYVPDYNKQENDVIVMANKRKVEVSMVAVTIAGKKYAAHRLSPDNYDIYDYNQYLLGNLLKVGTLRKVNGKMIFDTIIR